VGCEVAAKVVLGILARPAVHRRNVQLSMTFVAALGAPPSSIHGTCLMFIARMTSLVTIGGQKWQAYRVCVICAAFYSNHLMTAFTHDIDFKWLWRDHTSGAFNGAPY
jgi:hypothetical protein